MSIEVSFYIPVFNGERTIQNCLESILSQSIKVNEIIVINDASKDSANILENILQLKLSRMKIIKGLDIVEILELKTLKIIL